jgi:excisionase family DNA binding protein
MSSTIKIQRICQCCGKEFTARTSVTKFCSLKCASKAYKAKLRNDKIETSDNEVQLIKTKPIEVLKAKEFLTVRDVASLLNCSLRTAYRLVGIGTIKAVNLSERKTTIRRSDIDKIFEQFNPPLRKEQQIIETVRYEISDCYNLTEVQNKYGISEKALHDLIKRNGIPKIKKGWYAFVPKPIIDSLLS